MRACGGKRGCGERAAAVGSPEAARCADGKRVGAAKRDGDERGCTAGTSRRCGNGVPVHADLPVFACARCGCASKWRVSWRVSAIGLAAQRARECFDRGESVRPGVLSRRSPCACVVGGQRRSFPFTNRICSPFFSRKVARDILRTSLSPASSTSMSSSQPFLTFI